MQRFLRIVVLLIASIASGIFFFCGSIAVLMSLGSRHHHNYEYYGQYPVLYVTPGLVGFFLPMLLVWLFRKTNRKEGAGVSDD